MGSITGVDKLVGQLRSRAAAARKDADASVSVGYSANYAVFVHENLEARHKVGQAKFLEQPAREMKEELAKTVRENLLRGRTMSQSLLIAGLRLQRESQRLVPVETAVLKNSAYTRLDAKED